MDWDRFKQDMYFFLFIGVTFIFLFAMFSLVKSYFETERDIKKNIGQAIEQIRVLYQTETERAYFCGQRDALNKDIRIKQENGRWYWIKSPWDDGKKWIFSPEKSNGLIDINR